MSVTLEEATDRGTMPELIQQITKQELRKQYRAIRNGVSANVRSRESKAVCRQMTENAIYGAADAVFCYLSYGSELETDSLVQRAWSDGKLVAVPVIKGREMNFCRIYPETEYRLNEYGILEPVTEEDVNQDSLSSVLMILPGLCYDKFKGRIGYGGGYYDRYLAKHGNSARFQTVSLALSCQYFDGCIPMEEHDIRPDEIIFPHSFV